MRKSVSVAGSVLDHVAWESFLKPILDSARDSRKEGVKTFDGGIVRLSPSGKPEKISFDSVARPEWFEDVSVFFDEIWQVSRIQRKLSGSRSFDNGVRRGPMRRSLVSEAAMLQEFDAEGKPARSSVPHRYGHVEVHIHTRAFVGGTNHETANTFLEYDFEGKSLLPAGDRIADMTSHFPGEDRIRVYEFFMDSEASNGGLGELDDPRTKLREPTSEALVKTVEGRLNYRVYVGENRIAIHMGDAYVTSFDQRPVFGLAEVSALCDEIRRTGESGSVTVLVADEVSRLIQSDNA